MKLVTTRPIALTDIERSHTNPRQTFSEESIRELADSIKASGLLQPITVRQHPTLPKYEIICGERRYRAHQLLESGEIQSNVVEATDEEVRQLQLVENLQREGLNPMEEARGLEQLQQLGMTTAQIAEKLGKGTRYVLRRLSLVKLP
jgi:ParB family chromosome partitioning protein